MAISDKIDRMTAGVNRAADSLARLNDEIDRAASTEFTEAPRIVAPASFSPPPPPGAPGTPTNPFPSSPLTPTPRTLFGPDGVAVRTFTSAGRTGASGAGGSGGGSGSSLKLPDNPLVRSLTPGGLLLRLSDLEGLVSSGVCHVLTLPSGGEVISCPWGLYPGLGGGVLAATSGRSSGGSLGADEAGGVGGGGSIPTGNQDRSRRFNTNVTNNTTGRQFGSSASSAVSTTAAATVQLDSRPITDRLDGLRSDIRELSRSIAGDGGAGIRFKGGL